MRGRVLDARRPRPVPGSPVRGVRVHRSSAVPPGVLVHRDARGVPLVLRAAWPHPGPPLPDRGPVAERRLLHAGVDLRLPAVGDERRDPPAREPSHDQPAVPALHRPRGGRPQRPPLHRVRDDGAPRVQPSRPRGLLQGTLRGALPRAAHQRTGHRPDRHHLQGGGLGGGREPRTFLERRRLRPGARDARLHGIHPRRRGDPADAADGRRHRLWARTVHVGEPRDEECLRSGLRAGLR